MEDEEENQFELAEANSVHVLETNVLHASDVVYWLDGSSAEAQADMSRVPQPLGVTFSEKPRDLKVLNAVGRMALWRKPSEDMVAGRASQAQRSRPTLPSFVIAGEAWDLRGQFNPRVFSLEVGAGGGVAVELYPALSAIRIPPAGAVRGSLRFADSDNAVAWGLLTLEVNVEGGQTLRFRAQADGKGDYLLPLHRLPPLPNSITDYAAVLKVTADPAGDGDSAPDHSAFATMNLESATEADDFLTELPLSLRPGEVQRVNSFSKDHIAVQPA